MTNFPLVLVLATGDSKWRRCSSFHPFGGLELKSTPYNHAQFGLHQEEANVNARDLGGFTALMWRGSTKLAPLPKATGFI